MCPDADGPVFAKSLFMYRIYEGTTGIIGQVSATYDDPIALQSLRYRLNYNNGAGLTSLKNVIKIDETSGEISIVENNLPENTFNVEVVATVEVEDTTKVGSSRIVVAIDENEQCSAITVEKSLALIRITEEQENTEIFPMSIQGCEYEILSIIPMEVAGEYKRSIFTNKKMY